MIILSNSLQPVKEPRAKFRDMDHTKVWRMFQVAQGTRRRNHISTLNTCPEPRDTKGRAATSLRMARRSQSYLGINLGARNRINEAEVAQRGDSPVLVIHDGVTKSIFAHLTPAKGVDFPSCEKVVKMIVKDLDTLGYHRVVFRCDNEPPHSVITQNGEAGLDV